MDLLCLQKVQQENNSLNLEVSLRKPFSILATAISSSQLYLITSYEEPKNAWDVLKKHFERETLAKRSF